MLHFCRKIGGNIEKEKVDVGDKRNDAPERGGRLANLLKKTNLKRWVGTLDLRGNEGEVHVDLARSVKTFMYTSFAMYISGWLGHPKLCRFLFFIQFTLLYVHKH